MPKTTTTVDTMTTKVPPKPPTICFRLSEKRFMDIGWTVDKSNKPVMSMVLMKAKFSHPVLGPWFRKRSRTFKAFYAGTNKILYEAEADGTGSIYYPDGRLAVDIRKGGIDDFRTRVWVYSPQEVDKDGVSRPHQLCALFDSLGNGVVYDHCMRRRLVYNQTAGAWLDSPYGVPIYWRWHDMVYSGSMSSINEEDKPSELLPCYHMSLIWSSLEEVKSKDNSDSAERRKSSLNATTHLADFLEVFDKKFYVDTKKVFPRRVSPLKPIFVQINRYISLRLSSQSDVVLSFFAKPHHLTKLNIGVLYNPFDKLKVTSVNDSARFSKVLCNFEDLPAKTESILKFQKIVKTLRKGASCSSSLRK